MTIRSEILVATLLAVVSSEAATLPPDTKMVLIPAATFTYNFDNTPAGSLPKELDFMASYKGTGAQWQVTADPEAPSRPNVLAQTGQSADQNHFAFAFLKTTPIADGSMTAKFKAMRGEESLGAGFVYRYQSPQAFYVIWADAKDESCSLIRMKDGKPKVVDTKQVIVTENVWHTMRVVFALKTYALYLDDDLVMGGKDTGILQPGRVGLCTRGDAVTEFDDWVVAH